MSIRNDIVKELLLKRARVSIKMSSIANDIAARGRRHDNSYTDDSEMSLLIALRETDDEELKTQMEKLLKGIHALNNDYIPGYHSSAEDMNMIQLIEYITHRITEYDELVVNKGYPKEVSDYQKFVWEELYIEEYSGLYYVVGNTVEYIVDRNNSIIKNLPKSAKEISADVLNEAEDELNGKE